MRGLMLLSLVGLAGGSAAPAQQREVRSMSAPVYLSCELQENQTRQTVDLTINEATESVTIFQKDTGRTVSRKAVFSPSEVRVPDDESTWVVDRVSLAIRREVMIGERRWVDQGKCQVRPQLPNRAF